MGTASGTVRSVVGTVREKDVTFLAASIAFYAFFSLIPAILLVIGVGSLVGGETFAEQIVSFVESYLSSEGEEIVDQAFDAPGQVGGSIVGLVALAWSALKVFRAVDTSFDRIYRAEKSASLPRQLVHGVVVLVAIVVGLGLIIATRFAVGQLGIPYANLLGGLFLIAGLVVVFLPLYYVMPPVSVSVREILPGTVTAVVGWLVLQSLFGVYAANADQYEVYGVVGAVLLFLLWLYLGAMLLLVGAVVNAVTARPER